MKPLKLSDILKPGAKLSARKLDLNDPEVKNRIEECRRQQRLCLERKKIDYDQLFKIRITI